MEREIEGFPGFSILFEDGEIKLLKKGRVLQPQVEHGSLWWRLNNKLYNPETIIEATFPELHKRDYIYTLYKDVREEERKQMLTKDILPGIKLTKLWDKNSYYLETPVWMELAKPFKKMFGGTQIQVTEGNEIRRWREFYFSSTDCMRLVRQKILDFFEDNPDFLEEPDIY